MSRTARFLAFHPRKTHASSSRNGDGTGDGGPTVFPNFSKRETQQTEAGLKRGKKRGISVGINRRRIQDHMRKIERWRFYIIGLFCEWKQNGIILSCFFFERSRRKFKLGSVKIIIIFLLFSMDERIRNEARRKRSRFHLSRRISVDRDR